MTYENKIDQMEMLQYIRFGHKYKDKKSSFVFTPYDVILRDTGGNYMGTAYYPIVHLIGTVSSINTPDKQEVKQRLTLDYVFQEMYHYDEDNKI